MQISIDTTQELSQLDYRILAAIGGVATEPAAASAPAAKKAAAAPTAKKAAAAKPEPEPDLIGDDTEPTLEDAVTRATKLIADGAQTAVKTALTDVGAARVSTLEADQVAPFMAALDAAGI